MFAIVVLKSLCVTGTSPGFGGSSHRITDSLLGMQVLLLVMSLGVWASFACRLGLTELHLDLGWLPSDPISCFTTPGSIFIFTGCQFFLNYSIFGLVGGALPLASLHLVQLIENADSFTVVSAGLTQILVFMTLCAAGIVTGFDSSAFPNMQVIAVGVGLTAFCLVMPTDVLHLDLVLLPSDQRCCFTPPGSIFMLTDCKFFLDGLVAANGLAATFDIVMNTELTDVSGYSIVIMALINL